MLMVALICVIILYISACADKNYAAAWILTRKQYATCKIYPESMHVLDTLMSYIRTLSLAHETAVRWQQCS